MEQHPVPQHIASYEFRLVGDMTIRQFGFIATCCIVALIFYALPIPGYFKWPAIIFFVLLGVGLAFFPIEGRPLHRWIIAFFQAVYSPTQFLWKKKPIKLEIFEEAAVKKLVPKKPAVPPDHAKLKQYLQTLPEEESPLEKAEEKYLKNVISLFQVTQIPVAPVPTPPIPSPPPPPIEPTLPPKEMAIPKPLPPRKKPPKVKPFKIQVEPEKRKPAIKATISPHLPFPQTPQTPNLLVGMVLNQKGKMIEEAILEIRDSKGVPVRALKTNKLGQFRIVTPLKNGTYEIETEKEGYIFDIIKVELKGEPVSPIEIRGKGTAHES